MYYSIISYFQPVILASFQQLYKNFNYLHNVNNVKIYTFGYNLKII